MLDFTDGWVWLVAGLGATIAAFLFLLAGFGLARRSQQHAGRPK